MATVILPGFDSQKLIEEIQQATAENKVPFVVPYRPLYQRCLSTIREYVPNFRNISSMEGLVTYLRSGDTSGMLIDSFGDLNFPRDLSLGTFISLLTGNRLQGMIDGQAHRRFIPVVPQPTILVSMGSPEFSMNDWRRAFAEQMNPESLTELRNIFRTVIDSLRIIYVGCDDTHTVAFREWVDSGTGDPRL